MNVIKTYNDFLAVGDSESARAAFISQTIAEHRASALYRFALDAEAYDRQENVTITKYQKLLYTTSGRAVPDNYSANHKVASNYLYRFTTQQCQYLLGNGVRFNDAKTSARLGPDFDRTLQYAARSALVEGVAFGFFNLDHLEVFRLIEFVPLYDEENGGLSAGIRFWQLAPDKPLRATLYEQDGYTEYVRPSDGELRVLREKRPYVLKIRSSPHDGVAVYDGANYPTFPIVPIWGNPHRQSELVGLRSQIDAYDLIKSGFANDLDDASMIYWTISNAGGMDDIDLAKFVERMKTVKAAVVDTDGAQAEAHTIDVPHQAREAYLIRLERDMYADYMALDVTGLASGQRTATEMRAAYAPLDLKTDQFEYCVSSFIAGVLAVAGVEDTPTYTRSRIANMAEETDMYLSAMSTLPQEYVISKLLTLWGDGDRVKEVLDQLAADDSGRFDNRTDGLTS